jgi:hypothetical protein
MKMMPVTIDTDSPNTLNQSMPVTAAKVAAQFAKLDGRFP